MKNTNKGLVGILVVTVVALLLLYLFIFPGWYNGYSDGARTGDVYKFSKKGLIWKSWEGEMYLGGVHSAGQNNLELDKFYFSIPSSEEKEKEALIDKINKCVEDRLVCKIQYKQWFKSPITMGSNYDVVGVEIKK